MHFSRLIAGNLMMSRPLCSSLVGCVNLLGPRTFQDARLRQWSGVSREYFLTHRKCRETGPREKGFMARSLRSHDAGPLAPVVERF